MKSLILFLFLNLICLFSFAQNEKSLQINDSIRVKTDLMYSDDFSEGMENWYPEIMPGGEVKVTDQEMEIDVPGGCTVWYLKKLSEPVMIEYEVVVLDEGGPNDRVSDLNSFWMAQDPENQDDFFKNSENRGGKFSNYNPLRLYYTGVGGHNNTKTRFRRYMGDGTKPLLPEHDLSDEKYLIKANTLNKIRLVDFGHIVQYYRNGELVFDFYDPEPYSSGYFGIRTVENHMTVDNVKIYKLELMEKKKGKEKAKAEIFETEKAFEKMVKEKGLTEAFYHFAAEDAVIKRGRDSLISGRENIKDFYSKANIDNTELTWTPDFIEVSDCGTLGYSYGKYLYEIKTEEGKETDLTGVFLTIWKKQKDGAWKFVWD